MISPKVPRESLIHHSNLLNSEGFGHVIFLMYRKINKVKSYHSLDLQYSVASILGDNCGGFSEISSNVFQVSLKHIFEACHYQKWKMGPEEPTCHSLQNSVAVPPNRAKPERLSLLKGGCYMNLLQKEFCKILNYYSKVKNIPKSVTPHYNFRSYDYTVPIVNNIYNMFLHHETYGNLPSDINFDLQGTGTI